MRRLLVVALALCASLACDPPAPPVQAGSGDVVARWRSVLTLRANQRTLLAPGSGGSVYFAQPDDDAWAAVQVIDAAGEIRTTPLAPERVARLIKIRSAEPQLRAMEALPDGRLVAYFAGTYRTRSLASLVIYDPSADKLSLVAGPEELAQQSGMGLTIDLADAQLARTGGGVWLFLRHVDQSVFLRIDARQLGGGAARLARPFVSLRLDNTPVETDPTDQIFGQADETLYLLRRSNGLLFRISGQGNVYPVTPPEDLGRSTVAPLVTSAPSQPLTRLWFFADRTAYDDPLIAPTLGETRESIRYPVLLIEASGQTFRVDRRAMEIRQAFPLYAMRITRWTFDRAADRILAYDAMSGEILRLEVARQ